MLNNHSRSVFTEKQRRGRSNGLRRWSFYYAITLFNFSRGGQVPLLAHACGRPCLLSFPVSLNLCFRIICEIKRCEFDAFSCHSTDYFVNKTSTNTFSHQQIRIFSNSALFYPVKRFQRSLCPTFKGHSRSSELTRIARLPMASC